MTQTTTLRRLLNGLHHAVFDTAPDAALALRVSHPSGAVWSVADGVLTVQAGSGSPIVFVLGSYTIGQLASALAAAGFTATVSPEFAGRSALVLVETDDRAATVGDGMTGFRSLVWALYTGYAGELRDAKLQVDQALRQMVITQAEGEWLDIWGALYGVQRNTSETDAAYAPRIPKEAFRSRVNALAIELAIFEATGFDVRIEEPWKQMFRLDFSLLSGGDKLYDGTTIGNHLIQPVGVSSGIDWPAVLAVIERNRPAGVLVLDPIQYPGPTLAYSAQYVSQTWAGATTRTWATASPLTWASVGPVIETNHTRS